MFDPGPSLVTVLVLGLGPSGPPGQPVVPEPPVGEACVLLVPALYLGGRLEPCAAQPPRPLAPPPVLPLRRPGHSASDE